MKGERRGTIVGCAKASRAKFGRRRWGLTVSAGGRGRRGSRETDGPASLAVLVAVLCCARPPQTSRRAAASAGDGDAGAPFLHVVPVVSERHARRKHPRLILVRVQYRVRSPGPAGTHTGGDWTRDRRCRGRGRTHTYIYIYARRSGHHPARNGLHVCTFDPTKKRPLAPACLERNHEMLLPRHWLAPRKLTRPAPPIPRHNDWLCSNGTRLGRPSQLEGHVGLSSRSLSEMRSNPPETT